MIIADYHLHTSFSVDSDAEMSDMAERAIELGLKEIAITDHQDYLPDGRDYDFAIDYNAYIERFEEVRLKYRSRINILLGLEIGLMPWLAQRLEDFAACYPFEFIIGSSHDTCGISHYSGQFFNNKEQAVAYREYLTEILADVEAVTCFDVLGHIDYIPRYGIYEDNSLYYSDYADIIDRILAALIERGKGLEVNTSGVRYGLGSPHPQLAILKRFRELGGEIVTIGSDAHRPADIGHSFDIAREIIKSAGFNAYALFKNRKPVFIDLV